MADGADFERAWEAVRGLRHWIAPCGETPPDGIEMPQEVWDGLRAKGEPTLVRAFLATFAAGEPTRATGEPLADLAADIFNRLRDLAAAILNDPGKQDLNDTDGGFTDRPVLRRASNQNSSPDPEHWRLKGTNFRTGQILSSLRLDVPQGLSLYAPSRSGPSFPTVELTVTLKNDNGGLLIRCLAGQSRQTPETEATAPVSLSLGELGAAALPEPFGVFVQGVRRAFVLAEAEGLLGGESASAPAPGTPKATSMNAALERHLRSRGCVILQGPPGTGKTHAALEFVKHLSGDLNKESTSWSALVKVAEERRPRDAETRWAVDAAVEDVKSRGLPVVWELVQMHPSYAYEDFVRGMGTADREGGGIHFEPKDRVVLELALVAEAVAPRPVILIMDEINRCSLASVLGELILALEPDKRGREIRLQHGGAVKIPKNLWFIGTMNTADRSIALVDYAIRRRFRFIDVPPSEEALDSFYADKQARPEQVQAAKEAMNAIGVKIGPPNLKVGPSYFMEHPTEPTGLPWPERMADRLIYEVLPLLREYSREDSSVVTGPIEIGAARIDVTEQVAEDFEAKHRSAIRAFFAAQKP